MDFDAIDKLVEDVRAAQMARLLCSLWLPTLRARLPVPTEVHMMIDDPPRTVPPPKTYVQPTGIAWCNGTPSVALIAMTDTDTNCCFYD